MGDSMSFIDHTTEQFAQHISQCMGTDRFLRESAWEAFMSRGLPTRRVENWRYTNLRLLNQLSSDINEHAVSVDDHLSGLPQEFSRVLILDGVYRPDLSDFVVGWTREMKPSPLDADKHPMAVLNLAMSSGGLDLVIPAGTVLDKPILILHIATAASAGQNQFFTHHIRLETGAKASILMQYVADPKISHANNVLVNIDLQPNAHLGYYVANTESDAAVHIEGIHVEQQQGSVLDSFVMQAGSRLSRIDLCTAFLGQHSTAHMNGIYAVDHKQHVDIHLNAEHIASHCSTKQSVRGVASGGAKAVFNGRVCVHQHAAKSYSEQENHNLLLSNTAEVDTKPELEIYHDDVKCSHGATVGQLDAEALFYLISRGIAPQDARGMLMRAFVEQQFDLIQDLSVKEYFKNLFFNAGGVGS